MMREGKGRHGTARYDAGREGAARRVMMQEGKGRHGTARYDAGREGAARHSAL